MGLGNVEDLLDRRAQPVAEQPAGADRDLALHGLKARAGGVIPRVQERGQPRAPVRLEEREQHRPAWRRRRRPGRAGASAARRRPASSRSWRRSPGRCPRSGCSAISSTAAPPTPITGPTTVRRLRAIFGRAAITAAVCRTSASFMISLGWNCSGPAPSQRRAPLTLTPMPGDLHQDQHHERGEQQQLRVAPDEVEVQPRDDLHPDQADRAVGEVLDQVHRAVALALQQRPRATTPSRPSPPRPRAGRRWR